MSILLEISMSKSQIRILGRRRTFFLSFAESKLQGRGSNFFFVFLLLGYEIISQVFWIFKGISEIFKNFQPFSILRTEGFDLLSSTESTELSRELGRVYRFVPSYTEFLPIPCMSRIWCRYRHGLDRVDYESAKSYQTRRVFEPCLKRLT